MKELNFTDVEKKYIKETLQIVLKDIRNLYMLAYQETMFIEIDLKESDKYLLCIDDKKIALLILDSKSMADEWKSLWNSNRVNFNYDGNVVLETRKRKLGKNREKDKIEYSVSKNKIKCPHDLEIITRFLAQYEEIRTEIVKSVEFHQTKKNGLLDKLERIRTKYSGEVLVDFGTTSTQNRQEIEVTEENGKKVGTIDFGSRLVKIITEGDIVLTQIERAKEKIKQ